VLKGEVAKRVKELLYECADVNGWRIDELNIQSDHIHMIVQLCPDVSVSRAVQLFKGKSSRIIRREFPKFTEFFWGASFWSDGFFVEMAGKVGLDRIKKYVRGQ